MDPSPAVEPIGHETVLVVDDDPMLLRVAVRALRQFGYDAHGARSPAEALATIRDGLRPAVLLTDLDLQGASGTDLAMAVRDLLPEVRVVLMSGSDPGALEEAPVDGRLEKPFTPRQLADRVRRLLRTR